MKRYTEVELEELYIRAKDLTLKYQKANPEFFKRKLKIGIKISIRIYEKLIEDGVIEDPSLKLISKVYVEGDLSLCIYPPETVCEERVRDGTWAYLQDDNSLKIAYLPTDNKTIIPVKDGKRVFKLLYLHPDDLSAEEVALLNKYDILKLINMKYNYIR
ncbi:MAG: hypothetical protein M3Q63_02235 [bacterium]|nr:hypothetical protein [bacterium]